jgi:hypothetical protein
MSLPEQLIYEKLLENMENFLGNFKAAFGGRVLSQSTALNGTNVFQARLPFFWDIMVHQWAIDSQHLKAM